MKKLLLALIFLISLGALGVTYIDASNAELGALATSAQRAGAPLTIPTDATDPIRVSSALANAALKTGSNVFRTVLTVDAQGHPGITQYAYLSSDKTRLLDRFKLLSGRFPTPGETQAGEAIVSSTGAADAQRIGRLSLLSTGVTVSILPMSKLFDVMPAPGTYFVECPNSDCSTFRTLLASGLGARSDGTAYTDKDLDASAPNLFLPTTTSPIYLTVSLYAGLLLTGLLLVYWQFNEAKRAAAMRLHGYSSVVSWWRIAGRFSTTVSLASGSVCVGLGAVVSHADGSFVANVVRGQLLIVGAVLALGSLSIPYISRLRLSDALKSRRDTRSLFGASVVLTILCATGMVVVGTGAYSNVRAIDDRRREMQDWVSTSAYGVFAPVSNGNDAVELETGQLGPTTAESSILFDELSDKGALYVYASAYTPTALSQGLAPGSFRSMQVNPAFLGKYPVTGADGQPVSVEESDTDWVVLVPSTMRSQESDLLTYFEQSRKSAVQGQRSLFHQDVPTSQTDQKVRIVWTRPGQQVFTFDPAVSESGLITDPIVEVLTKSNSMPIDRLNAITGDASAGLKVPLVRGSSESTIASLLPLLKSAGLDDNLLHVVTINEYQLAQVAVLQTSLRNTLLVLLGIGLLLLVVTSQGTAIAFERYSRKIVVRGLFGASFAARYRELLILWLATALVQSLLSLLLIWAGLHPFAEAVPSLGARLLIATGIVFVQLLAAGVVLKYQEGKRMSQVLKGES